MTRSLLSAVIVVGVACASAPALAFSTMYNCRSAWHSSDLPVTYRVNQTPPSEINDIDEIRRIFRESFEVWGSPCCSAFAAVDGGTTTATGENNNDSQFTASFREDTWPRSLGDANSTLGVTLVIVDGGCNIVSADTVFNSVTFEYVDGNPQRFDEADLESIAVHEFGHFIGLGHTGVEQATMYPAYIGGTLARTLHADDEDGVCYLYEQACSCSGNGDCNSNQECIDSTCQIPPCTGNGDCDSGLECVNGDCVVPPCGGNEDCQPGHVCQGGSCVADADCPICGQCDTNADCGANGVCIPAGYISEVSACTSWCNTSEDCPGNTECFQVPTDEGEVQLCFNSDADVNGPCPSGFVCQDGGGGNLCDGVSCSGGQVCNPSTGTCQGGGGGGSCSVCDSCTGQSAGECGTTGACLSFIGGPTICSQPCDANGGCPGNSSCFQLEDENGGVENWCLNDDAASVGICDGGWACEVEPVDLCAGVSCGDGQTCNPATGGCEGGGGGGDDDPDAGLGDVEDRPRNDTSGVGGGGGDDDDSSCAVAGRSGGAGLVPVLAALALILVRRRRS